MNKPLWCSAIVALYAASGQAGLTLSNIRLTDPQSGEVSLDADVAGTGAGGGMVYWDATLDGGLLKLYREPYTLNPGASSWASSWNPYFRGRYDFKINAVDLPPSSYPVEYAASHTVGVARAKSGVLTAIQHMTAIPGGAWAPVDTAKVKLHCIGYNSDGEVASVGCNLLNADFAPGMGMTNQEDIDIGFTDMGRHYAAGTLFRFSVHLHARPTSLMGMGGLARFVWTPSDPAAPAGAGALAVDVASCNPWRSDYSNALSSHVGFAPLFFEDEEDAEEFEGALMCTTAHYLDVSPSLPEDESSRIGLVVNGHAGTTNYLQAFLPDRILETWGITNLNDPVAVEGKLGYFVDGLQLDPSVAAPEVTRVSDSSPYEFDWNGDGQKDSGYLVRFTFVFPPAAAGIKPAVAPAGVAAEIGPASSVPLGPLIRANGQTGSVVCPASEPVNLTLSLFPGPYAGVPVDWWAVACSYAPNGQPSAWFYLDAAGQWVPFDGNLATCRPGYQGRLFNLAPQPVLNARLPAGRYQAWFAVDSPMDGILDISGMIRMSTVQITVR